VIINISGEFAAKRLSSVSSVKVNLADHKLKYNHEAEKKYAAMVDNMQHKRLSTWTREKSSLCKITSQMVARTYLRVLTYSMEQSPSLEANRFSPNQKIPRILWNPKVHYLI